jgi:hypothetical protein
MAVLFRMEDMVELNRYSIEARYPGEWGSRAPKPSVP